MQQFHMYRSVRKQLIGWDISNHILPQKQNKDQIFPQKEPMYL